MDQYKNEKHLYIYYQFTEDTYIHKIQKIIKLLINKQTIKHNFTDNTILLLQLLNFIYH